MIAPDHGRPAAPRVRENDPAIRRRAQPLRRALPAITAIVITYLTLMPNTGHARFRIVPLPLYRWLAAPEHDWLVNIVAFGFLAAVVFLAGRDPDAHGGSLLSAIFAHRSARLAALLALVCAIELVQRWIPGRISALQDVCTGWSGIFAAWLLAVLLDGVRKIRHAPASEAE